MNAQDIRLQNSLNDFVRKQIDFHSPNTHIGTVVSYSAGVDLVVRITDIPEQEILLSFSEGMLLVLDGHSFSAGNQVILLPIQTKFLIMKLSATI